MSDNLEHLTSTPKKKQKGIVGTSTMKVLCFWVIALCLLASVVTSIFAIWDFAKEDVLWRLLATYAVIAAGAAVFAIANSLFADSE